MVAAGRLGRRRLPFPGASRGCYNLAALQQTPYGTTRFSDPARRGAYVLPLAQIGIGLVGSGLLAWGNSRPSALAFLAGAAVIAMGYAVFGWRTGLRSMLVPAERAFARLLLGSLLKWLLIGAGLATAMTTQGLPAEFVLGGALAAYLAYILCLPWLLR